MPQGSIVFAAIDQHGYNLGMKGQTPACNSNSISAVSFLLKHMAKILDKSKTEVEKTVTAIKIFHVVFLLFALWRLQDHPLIVQ